MAGNDGVVALGLLYSFKLLLLLLFLHSVVIFLCFDCNFCLS